MDWHVLYTNVKAEKRAALGLLENGFPIFLPLQVRLVKRRKKKVKIECPLFPRYLFVGGELEDGWRVDGVQGVLANDGKPMTVHESVIGALMETISTGEFNDREPSRIEAGARVRFSHGPFEGMTGMCRSVPSETCVEVLIKLLKREVAVKVYARHVTLIA